MSAPTGPSSSTPTSPVGNPPAGGEHPPRPAGLVLEPFAGLRYDPQVVPDLGAALAPPYDVLSAADVEGLHARSPYNATHLTRPTSYDDAAETYRAWLAAGALRADSVPTLYVYEQLLPGYPEPARGLLGALRLSPTEAGIVLPHEDTRPGPVADRLALMTATGADLEPILLVYDGSDAVESAIEAALRGPLLAEITTPDGGVHRLAGITDPETLARIAADLLPRRALIADGHHRHATYLARQAEHWAAGDGAGPWDFGLALLVDGERAGLQIRAIHRVLADVPYEQAVAAAAKVATVTELAGDHDAWLELLDTVASSELTDDGVRRQAFVFARGDEAVLVTSLPAEAVEAAVPADRGPAWRNLDVSVYAHFLLPEVLGVRDGDGTDEHDPTQASREAADVGGTAVLIRPVSFGDVLAVAAEGSRMPRKSTLFVPKPATGLVLRPAR